MTCVHFHVWLPQSVQFLINVVSTDYDTSVLLLLAKKAEPLLAILLFALFVAHGDAPGVT